MASKDIKEIKITTEDEIIDLDICNKVEIREGMKTKIKIYGQLCSDELIAKLKTIKKAKLSFCLHCKTLAEGNSHYEKTVYENISFAYVEKRYSYLEISEFVFVFKEDK